MPDLLIRNVEPDVVEQLKQRAEKHGRSLQAELTAIVKDATKYTREEWLAEIDRIATDSGDVSDMPSVAELRRQGLEERMARIMGEPVEPDEDEGNGP